ncbi:MAG: hypothetical protein J7L34_04485, partial [Thermotogaceae bacterium]|nr:hypothetical protein [Thermotogaceae bacterium]
MKVVLNSSPIMGGVYSAIYSITYMLVSHFWLMSTLVKNFSQLLGYKPIAGFLTFLLFLAYESLFFFVFGFLVSLFKNKLNRVVYLYVFIPSLYTFIDYIRSLGDLGYTGGMISDAFYKNFLILLLFSFIGSYGVELLAVLINMYFYNKGIKTVLYTLGIIYVVFYLVNIAVVPPVPHDNVKLELFQTNYDPLKRYEKNSKLLEG